MCVLLDRVSTRAWAVCVCVAECVWHGLGHPPLPPHPPFQADFVRGLSDAEVQRRRDRFGNNKQYQKKVHVRWWRGNARARAALLRWWGAGSRFPVLLPHLQRS
jgi:hypothetical protein